MGKKLQEHFANRARNPPEKKQVLPALVVKKISVENYRSALQIDTQRVKDIPADTQEGIDKRNAYIKNVISGYFPLIDEAIVKKTEYSDDILVRLMIWLFNAEVIDKAIDLALLVIEQGKQMPANFSNNVQNFVCDQVYDWAAKLYEKKESATPYIQAVTEKISVLDGVHLVVRSKMLAMSAKHYLLDNTADSLKAGIAYCDENMRINPKKHGVSTLLSDLQKALKKLS